MPLMILGLILLIGILIYAIIGYIRSGDSDTRPVRERYPHAFPVRESDVASGDGNKPEDTDDPDDNTIIFPSDQVEVEKRKRNIH